MKTAKQINILSETEVPFEVGSGFGSDYNIDLNNPSLYIESSHGMDDVTEVFEDDNYIVSTAKYGDKYTKSGYTHNFTRNNFVTDEMGNIYTGESTSLDNNMTTAEMPGYMPITFKRDMLALVWNNKSPTSMDWYTRYTGDAYCIKSISAVMEPNPSSGYSDITWYMNAKEISDDTYSNYEMGYMYSVDRTRDFYSFTPTSHSRVNVGGFLDMYNNEADSVICSQSELINWINTMFSRIGDTGATSTKIINYITNNMPYGGIITETRRTFLLRYGTGGWDVWTIKGFDRFSDYLNPTKGSYHTTPADGNAGKQWIIPFNSEEEYHAAWCAKQVTTFPYA